MARPSRLLRALLLQPGKSVEDALSGGDASHEVSLRGGLPYQGTLVLMEKVPTTPGWVDFLNEALPNALAGVANQSTGAALFVPVGDRLVVFTFGRGRNLIDPACMEDGFGLRVTLNAVDPSRVRAIDSRAFEDLVFHLSRQSSRNADLGAFAIDDSRDVLSAVAGVPRDSTIGSRIAGSDGVAISTKRHVDDLGEFAEQLVELWAADDYKASFAFIDQVREVGNPGLKSQLDAELESVLQADPSKVSLAPPQRVDYEDIAGYRYPRERRGTDSPHSDISMPDYLASRGGRATVAELRTDGIRLISASTEDTITTWKAFNCVVFETRIGEHAFILSNGKWFEVAADFVAEIEERLSHIPIVDLNLPEGELDEAESAYNARAVRETAGAALLDRVPFKPRGARTTIELADIAVGHRLLHVKRRTSSSTLSHLYAQGRVAAESLKSDPALRAELQQRLEAVTHPMAALLTGDRFDSRAIEITYVILSDHPGSLPAGLPFFSKLNLVRSREYLERTLDFQVAAAFVPQPD